VLVELHLAVVVRLHQLAMLVNSPLQPLSSNRRSIPIPGWFAAQVMLGKLLHSFSFARFASVDVHRTDLLFFVRIIMMLHK